MTNWQAWIAATGGLVALGELWPGTIGTSWYALIGGLTALIFGIWAVYS